MQHDQKVTPNNFDLIRLFAASEVAIKHAMVHLDVGASYSEALGVFPGVPIFFLISGFLIFKAYGNSASLRQFAANRLLRIYPALIVCFLLCLLMLGAFGVLDGQVLRSRQFLVWVLAQISFAQFYNPDFVRSFGVGVINGSLWTISVELQFYLLTPLIALLLPRGSLRWLAALAFFGLANMAMASAESEGLTSKLYTVSFIPWVYMFILGAWFSTQGWILNRLRGTSLVSLLLLLAGVNAACWAAGIRFVGNEINPLSFVALALVVLKVAYMKPHLSDAVLRRNDISYGIYIYHMPLVNLAIVLGMSGSVAGLAGTVIATMVFATLSWFVIERPALTLKRRALRPVGEVS